MECLKIDYTIDISKEWELFNLLTYSFISKKMRLKAYTVGLTGKHTRTNISRQHLPGFKKAIGFPKKSGYDKRRTHFSNPILTEQLVKDEFIALMNAEKKAYRGHKSDPIVMTVVIEFAKLVGMEKRKFR